MTEQPPTESLHKKDMPIQLRICVVVVSDSRYDQFTTSGKTDDVSGNLIKMLAEEYKHSVVKIEYVPDEIIHIEDVLKHYGSQDDVDLLIFTGGTGLTTRDVTIEAISPLLKKTLPVLVNYFANSVLMR